MNEPIDITGERFGYLTVIKRADDHYQSNGRRRIMWLCQCDCGKQKVLFGDNLRSNKSLSCGCLQKKRASEARKTHGDADSRLYNIWCAMKRRCNNSSVPEYKSYGGRGIKVCSLWESDYSSFMRWALDNGYDATAPRGVCTLDRIDVNGNYEPSNCRWVSNTVQVNNTRVSKRYEFNGESHNIVEWSGITGIPFEFMHDSIRKNNNSVEETIKIYNNQLVAKD